MERFLGTWKLESNGDTLGEFLKIVGVNTLFRKAGLLVTTYETFIYKGDNQMELKVTSTFKNFTIKFTLDEEFDEHTVDGRKFKSLIRFEDGKLVHYQRSTKPNLPDSKMTRYLEDDDKMIVLCELLDSDEPKATRIQKRYKD